MLVAQFGRFINMDGWLLIDMKCWCNISISEEDALGARRNKLKY
jgi:hypothetical protein